MTRISGPAALFAALLAALPAPAWAGQAAPPVPAPATTQAAPPRIVPTVGQRTILFVGNSFTFGAGSAAERYRADSVTDLNGFGYGGVPALFKAFAEQSRLAYAVSLETHGGKGLGFHWEERRQLLDRAWDVVVLQEFSTLDAARPGDAVGYRRYAALLAEMFTRANPRVEVLLMATWSRADQLYATPGGRWAGLPVDRMARDLRAAADEARRATPDIDGVIPVGEAWNRAFAERVADPNPYDGVNPGELDLWAADHYHASVYGTYLEALVVFGKVTGIDPRRLGKRERAAADLGITPAQAVTLQRIAARELAAKR